MVGIVVVSHSDTLAEGVVRLAREMASPELALETAGGLAEPEVLGTDVERVRAAIERAMSPDGVLVLMDLGSALMSAEFAVELLDDATGPVQLSDAPLVEGTVAAAVAASGGATLDQVAAEARGALAMKVAQIGTDQVPEGRGSPAGGEASAADVTAELEVRNAVGLHARPAARFVEVARGFDAEVRVAKVGAGPAVGAGSLTNLVSLGARLGDTLIVSACGPQAEQAVAALRELADGGFGDGIGSGGIAVAPPTVFRGSTDGAPSTERPAPGTVVSGLPATDGIGIGAAFVLRGDSSPPTPPPDRAPGSREQELALLEHGLADARTAVRRDRDVLATRAGAGEAEILNAHLALLDDEALLEPARTAIAAGATAERAIHDAAALLAAVYRALPDPLLAERGTDVLDVGRRVVAALTEASTEAVRPHGIVVADELTPADTAALDPALVLGVVTARGSATAHAAIIARSLGLPAVVGVGRPALAIAAGAVLLVDGNAGTVQVEPPSAELDAARERSERRHRRAAAARSRALEQGATRDGARIEMFANLGSAGEASRAILLGAEGVGLLRTEFLFLDRDELPGEEEQAETLREIAVALDGRPMVVRTLDAGADKPLPALRMPPETNPFLGVRGIRVGLLRRDLLATQFRAILRVAAEHPVKTMLPMVATLGEIQAARGVLAEARADTGIDVPMDFGIMVEVPAAALTATRLAAHVDFFSIGTNDLTQYTMAADRGDARLAPLVSGPQPAVLRLVRDTVQAARARCRWVGVCGELAGDPAAAVLLAGLGVTELSMAAGLIGEAKAALREVELGRARAAALAAIETDDPDAPRALALALL